MSSRLNKGFSSIVSLRAMLRCGKKFARAKRDRTRWRRGVCSVCTKTTKVLEISIGGRRVPKKFCAKCGESLFEPGKKENGIHA